MRTRGAGMSRVSLVILVLGAVLLPSGLARAQEPPYVGWTQLLPGLTTQYEPSSENDCAAGRTRCIDALIREMTRRFDRLAPILRPRRHLLAGLSAHHRGVPADVEDPTFFEDTAFVNHEDAVFARLLLPRLRRLARGQARAAGVGDRLRRRRRPRRLGHAATCCSA